MDVYTETALIKAKQGNMSMNQAYREYSNAGGLGSFKDFMSKAVNTGWIDQGLNTVSSVLRGKYGVGEGGGALIDTPCLDGYEKNADGICVEIKTGMSTFAKVGIAVGVIALIGGIAYYYSNSNKQGK
jgi:hypothetical protein